MNGTAVTTKPAGLPNERPVFVTVNGRRARLLRYGGVTAALLAGLWLAGLSIGMLGFGHLPGLSLPAAVRSAADSPERSFASVKLSSDVPGTADARTSAGQRVASALSKAKTKTASGSQRATESVSRPSRTRAAAKPAPAAHAAQPAVEAAAPAALRQGWARRGQTAPPGQSRRTEPKQPPVTPGQTRRNGYVAAPTTAPATPVIPPLPPGQEKKAAEESKPKG
jgi:hypothetical protein